MFLLVSSKDFIFSPINLNPVSTFNTSMLLAFAMSAPNSDVTIVLIRTESSLNLLFSFNPSII